MNAHAPKILVFLALAPLSLVAGCDQAVDGDLESLDRDAELAELAELDDAELVADEAKTVELDDLVDEEGKPLSSEIFVVGSSPEDQLRDEMTSEGDSPTLAELGHAIGIGPEDVPTHADDLASANDPSAALSLDYEGHYNYGGNMWSMSYDIIRGHSSCGAGRTRSFASAYAEGSGSCFVLGWYTFDPNDCRIRVRVNQPGWFEGGTCKMFVYDQ